MELISTRHGPFHPFEQEWERCRKWDGQWDKKACKVKRFKVDIYDAVRDGLAVEVRRAAGGDLHRPKEEIDAEFIQTLREGVSQFVWETEYECKLPTSGLGLISIELYNSLKVGLPRWDRADVPSCGPLYVGWDIGRSHDLSVIWAYELVVDKNAVRLNGGMDAGSHLRLLAVKELSNMPYQRQLAEAVKIVGHDKVEKCCVDQGSIGNQLSEDLQRMFGRRVEGISIGQTQKKDMFDKLQKYAEQRRLEFPDDRRIEEDICSMRRQYTQTGQEQYIGGTKFSHADFATAAALAVWGVPEAQLGRAWSVGKPGNAEPIANSQ